MSAGFIKILLMVKYTYLGSRNSGSRKNEQSYTIRIAASVMEEHLLSNDIQTFEVVQPSSDYLGSKQAVIVQVKVASLASKKYPKTAFGLSASIPVEKGEVFIDGEWTPFKLNPGYSLRLVEPNLGVRGNVARINRTTRQVNVLLRASSGDVGSVSGFTADQIKSMIEKSREESIARQQAPGYNRLEAYAFDAASRIQEIELKFQRMQDPAIVWGTLLTNQISFEDLVLGEYPTFDTKAEDVAESFIEAKKVWADFKKLLVRFYTHYCFMRMLHALVPEDRHIKFICPCTLR